jgi:hypothetical protein
MPDVRSDGPAVLISTRSVAPDADRSLHAAALVHQAVLIELATIDAAVTAVQPAGIIGDAGLAPAGNAAAGFEQVYFHG